MMKQWLSAVVFVLGAAQAVMAESSPTAHNPTTQQQGAAQPTSAAPTQDATKSLGDAVNSCVLNQGA